MAFVRTKQKPSFALQAALILLPVVFLAIITLVSLRQDRVIAEREAADRAQGIADDLLPRLKAELFQTTNSDSTGFVVELNEAGALVFPPPYDPVPKPEPLDLNNLSGEQAALWTNTQTRNGRELIESLRRFLDSNPPARFAAVAEYELSLLIAPENPVEAIAMLRTLPDKYPDAVGETGISMAALARFKAFEIGARRTLPAMGEPRTTAIATLCSNLVFQPTALTSELLRELAGIGDRNEIATWQRIWRRHEITRELYSALQPTLATRWSLISLQIPGGKNRFAEKIDGSPDGFWFKTDAPISALAEGNATNRTLPPEIGREWHALGVSEGETRRLICHSEIELGRTIARVVRRETRIPEYFGVGVEVGGRRLEWNAPDLRIWEYQDYATGKGGGSNEKQYQAIPATRVLASATGAKTGLLAVRIYLTSPKQFEKLRSARAFWFGLLVMAAAIAALIGLFAAWRAFQRQQQLVDLKSDFVSSVSHELRAPIASVRLMAESLEHGKVREPEKQSAYFKFIGQECRRLSSLIENVLDFSRIEQGRKLYEFDPTDIVALVRDSVRLMEPNAAERGVRLEWNSRLADPAPELRLDGRAIQQALINLIENAIKHSPTDSTVTVQIASAAGGLNGSLGNGAGKTAALLTISVSDEGPGIPANEQEKIFERFYRLGSELRRETQGVGIGLSIVKHVVEAHHGRVIVRSEPGKGSCFTMELPVTDNPVARV